MSATWDGTEAVSKTMRDLRLRKREKNEGRKLKIKALKEESEEKKVLKQGKKHIEWESWITILPSTE